MSRVNESPAGKGAKRATEHRRSGVPAARYSLYRLDWLAGADHVFVTGSKKCADRACQLGLSATTPVHGVRSADSTDWSPVAGRRVTILRGRGAAGRDFADAVVRSVAKLKDRPEVRVIDLPELLKDGDDFEQYIEKKIEDMWSDQEICNEIEGLAVRTQPLDLDESLADNADDTDDADTARETPGRKPSQAEILIELADSATLFHTSDGKAYASVPVGDHCEHYPVKSTVFRQWLDYQFYLAQGTAPSSEATRQALATVEARARFEGDETEVHLRVAEVNGPEGKVYYLNLADKQGRAVRITSKGWEVITDPPVKFLRNKTMLPLPVPEEGGSVEELREFLNVGSEQEFQLSIAALCAYVRPTGPYPVMVIQGEQGSAKSTATRIVSRLIDPSDVFRGTIRNEQDLMIAAKNSWVVTSDNLSGLPPWLSDAFCRLATGSGLAVRQLYSDDEETVYKATRPIVLNGIDDIAERPDLADRSVVMHLVRIPSHKRLSEQVFWARFDAGVPRFLGALLTGVAGGLRELPNVRLDRTPRMADFTVWGEAVAQALGWGAGAFLKAYEQNLSMSSVVALEACSVASTLVQFMASYSQDEWSGTATELLSELRTVAGEEITRAHTWPKMPNKLSSRLRRVAPALLEAGVEVVFPPPGKTRRIVIRKVQAEKAVQASSAPSNTQKGADNLLFPMHLGGNGYGADDRRSPSSDRRASSATSSTSLFPNRSSSNGLGQTVAGSAYGHDDADDGYRSSSGEPVPQEVDEDDDIPF